MEDVNYWKSRPKDDKRVDWRTGGNWINEYWESQKHPHRQVIVDALNNPNSVLELGCNCGPNLAVIKKEYPTCRVAGIDVNADCINHARLMLKDEFFQQGDITDKLMFPNGSFDYVIVDAVLMYVGPDKIINVLKEMSRVAKRGIVIVDWFDDDRLGVEKDHHWARNYPLLLEELGYKVKTIPLTEATWPHERWQKYGKVFVASL